MHQRYLECWRVLFLLLFLTYTVCLHHLWDVRPQEEFQRKILNKGCGFFIHRGVLYIDVLAKSRIHLTILWSVIDACIRWPPVFRSLHLSTLNFWAVYQRPPRLLSSSCDLFRFQLHSLTHELRDSDLQKVTFARFESPLTLSRIHSLHPLSLSLSLSLSSIPLSPSFSLFSTPPLSLLSQPFPVLLSPTSSLHSILSIFSLTIYSIPLSPSFSLFSTPTSFSPFPTLPCSPLPTSSLHSILSALPPSLSISLSVFSKFFSPYYLFHSSLSRIFFFLSLLSPPLSLPLPPLSLPLPPLSLPPSLSLSLSGFFSFKGSTFHYTKKYWFSEPILMSAVIHIKIKVLCLMFFLLD